MKGGLPDAPALLGAHRRILRPRLLGPARLRAPADLGEGMTHRDFQNKENAARGVPAPGGPTSKEGPSMAAEPNLTPEQVMLDPENPQSLFEPVNGYRPHELGNNVECKACAGVVLSIEPALRRHAEQRQKLSDGSTGACGDFWRSTHADLLGSGS